MRLPHPRPSAARLAHLPRLRHARGGTLAALLLLLAAAACERDAGSPAGGRAGAAKGAGGRVSDTARGEVGIDIAGPGGAVLLVPVYINGKGPFDFVLDTGATMTCLDQALADQLDLPPRFGQVGVGIGVGATGQVPIVRIDSLRAGGTTAEKVSACILDLAHLKALGPKVEGLLGLNFLKSYRVTLDFRKKVARLEKP